MDTDSKKRISALVAGIEAVQDEARRRGVPVEPIPGGTDLVECLRKLLAGDDLPVQRWLGLLKRDGRPAIDDQAKIELIRQHRLLRLQGKSSDEAAEAVGVDQRTLTRWRGEVAGVAEEVEARIDGLGCPQRGRRSKDKT